MKIISNLALLSLLYVPLSSAWATSPESHHTSSPNISIEKKIAHAELEIRKLKSEMQKLRKKKDIEKCQKNSLKAMMLGSVPVYVAPYLGDYDRVDGSNLIVNTPGFYLGPRLIDYRHWIQKRCQTLKEKETDPVYFPTELWISGNIEAQTQAQKTNYINPNHPSDGMNGKNSLSAELIFTMAINSWFMGNVALGANTDENRHVSLDRARILIGDFSRTLWNGALGHCMLPFASSRSWAISDPLTYPLGKTKNTALSLGYGSPTITGIYGSVNLFGDKLDLSSPKQSSAINHVNVDLGFNQTTESGLRYDMGLSYLTHMLDSTGWKSKNNEGFDRSHAMFSRSPGAISSRATFDVKKTHLTFDYVSSIGSFSQQDVTFNGRAVKPSAFHVEGAYDIQLFNKDASVSLGYSKAKQSLHLSESRQQYTASLGITPLHYMALWFEINHQKGYRPSDVATYRDITGNIISFSPLTRSSNQAILKAGIFF